MSNATYEKMKSMHLSAMAQAYQQQLADPQTERLSFEERLAMLTDIEFTSRKNNRLDRLVKHAAFEQPHAHLAEIDYSPRRELNRGLLLRLGTGEFIRDSRNVIIMGATGSGKTYLACALGMETCKQFYSVKFTRMPALLEDFHVAEATGMLRKLYKEFAKFNLLILDDWMLVQLTPEESRFIYEIVHRRHKTGSTIYCSQFAPAGWHHRIAEETLADAILDRIVYDSYTVEIKSQSDMPSMREKYGLRHPQG